MIAAPATIPAEPARPFGDLGEATPAELVTLMEILWPYSVATAWAHRRGMLGLLAHLSAAPGATWQQRWVASGLDATGRPVRTEIDGFVSDMSRALMVLFCLRVIRPSLGAFRSNQFVAYGEHFRTAQQDPRFDRFIEAVDRSDKSPHWKNIARFDVSCALTTQGIALADLTAESFLHYAVQTRAGGFSLYVRSKYAGHLAWEVLHALGQFAAGTPTTLRGALRAPPRTCEQLVDQYQVTDPGIRQLFVDYLRRRSYDLDHSSIKGMARMLCSNFWASVQLINPDQRDLNLGETTYQAWRAALEIRSDGKRRAGQQAILTTVRALYLDLQGWAAAEPERWAQWAAPCLIGNRDMRGQTKQRRRVKERMDGRTRTLQPLLSTLLAVVEQQHHHLAQLLPAAAAATPGDVITCGSKLYRRIRTPGDVGYERRHGVANVRVRDEATGRNINVEQAEDTAFWQWACVHTLRHTGVRNEELLELSQLSIRQYVRSNGQVVALLVIAPSKTDRERVIPMSAELFHVIACILRRLTRGNIPVPLATRYDKHENVTSDPQPFLFQRTIGQRVEVITPSGMRAMLARVCQDLATEHPELNDCHFTPHDFRRLLATELANSGLPIHIGAALLGHLNLQTFHGYVAVFNEDVVRHYQAHLANRRDARPAVEYRPISDMEWQEFDEHFDKRKVELGTCGRPYAAPCDHEHACVRCPMLRVDPAMIDRLNELETDLISRRAHAVDNGWLGETEGIDLTLRFLRGKRDEAQRLSRVQPVALALPFPVRRQPAPTNEQVP